MRLEAKNKEKISKLAKPTTSEYVKVDSKAKASDPKPVKKTQFATKPAEKAPVAAVSKNPEAENEENKKPVKRKVVRIAESAKVEEKADEPEADIITLEQYLKEKEAQVYQPGNDNAEEGDLKINEAQLKEQLAKFGLKADVRKKVAAPEKLKKLKVGSWADFRITNCWYSLLNSRSWEGQSSSMTLCWRTRT